jgi:hypothetical protein
MEHRSPTRLHDLSPGSVFEVGDLGPEERVLAHGLSVVAGEAAQFGFEVPDPVFGFDTGGIGLVGVGAELLGGLLDLTSEGISGPDPFLGQPSRCFSVFDDLVIVETSVTGCHHQGAAVLAYLDHLDRCWVAAVEGPEARQTILAHAERYRSEP